MSDDWLDAIITKPDTQENKETILIDNIPQTLKQINQWIVYGKRDKPFEPQYTTNKKGEKKRDKIPYNARTGGKAMSSESSTWTDFATAINAYNTGKYNGIGFVFAEDDGLAGIDLDHVLNPETGEQNNIATEILSHFPNTYIEISPSGDGYHIWLKGTPTRCGKGSIEKCVELYSAESPRYFTVTGKQLCDSGREPIELQSGLDWLHEHYFDDEKLKPTTKKTNQQINRNQAITTQATYPIPSDFDKTELLRRAKNDAKFISLWQGNYENYKSQSEADLALCNKLAFYLQGDAAQIDRAFRNSGLMRDKWGESHRADGQTYGEMTIQKACEDTTQYYQLRPIKVFELNELGNAARFIYRYGDKVRYCATNDKWLIYKGGYWEPEGNLQVENWAKETVKSIFQEANQVESSEHADNIRKWAKKSQSFAKMQSLLSAARSDVAIHINELDQQGMHLNCLNGTLNLETGKLEQPNPKHYHTRAIPINHDATAQCPTWLNFLQTIFNHDQELVNFIQRAVGYSLTNSIAEQCMFIMHGSGANGKSTFVDTLKIVLGRYAKTAAPDLLIAKPNNHPTELADLKGARFISVMETARGERLDENRVKQITGDMMIKARYMYKDFFEFPVEFKLWMATNHKPAIKDNNHAIWRRIHLIPFNVTIPTAKRDKHLLNKLKQELAGILNWALEGCLIYQRDGLQPPALIQEATKAYRYEEDTLSRFLAEKCIIDDKNKEYRTENKLLYKAYTQFCEDDGSTPEGKNAFGKLLKQQGFDIKRSDSKYFKLGIKLK